MKRGLVISALLLTLISVVFFVDTLICPIYASNNPVKVTVDPRMELLSAVQLLSKYGGCGENQKKESYSFLYKQEMAGYFAPYKNHRAVVLYDKMFPKFFNFDAPPTLMLNVSDPPTLRLRKEFKSNIQKIADQRKMGEEGVKSMLEFIDALREFAHDSNFQGFYSTHQNFYQTIISETEYKIGNIDIIGPVERYYGGSKPMVYTIVLVPLFHPGGYGPSIERNDGVREVYNICGPFSVSKDRLRFGDSKDISNLAWHEFGHSFVNPLADKYWGSLDQYSTLYIPISSAMCRKAYGSWKTCVNEHIVRAVHARIIYAIEGQNEYEWFMDIQRIEGFAYIKPLCKRLEIYEKQRDKYPTIQNFYPELVEVFKSLKEQDLGPDFYNISAYDRVCLQLSRFYPSWYSILKVFPIAIIPPVISSIWTYRDARKRQKRSLSIALLVLFGIWPFGFILYLLLRQKNTAL